MVPHWSSFIALSDIWIVFWGLECGHSEVANECKHSRLKCEGEKREGVVSLRVRMKCQIPSTVPLWQVSYVDNPGMRGNSEEREGERRGEASQSHRVHGRSLVMC